MYPERIPELDQDSLSLHDNTVIQYYNKLDYSDEFNESDYSNQHSLSESRCRELGKITQKQHYQELSHRQKQQQPSRNKPEHFRGAVRPIKDIESKYDLGISPSTKEEQSILNANGPIQRKSYQNRHVAVSKMPKIYSDQNESFNEQDQNYEDWEAENEQERQSYSSAKQSGRQARLAQQKKPHFNIDNFLNAQPIVPKSKKGLSVLNVSSKEQKGSKVNKQKKQFLRNETIKQQETINLVTIPEVEIERAQKILQNIKNAEKQLQSMKSGYERRFRQARLSFIDTFMPQPLKIKSNPYNLLKYMTKCYQ